MLTEKRQYRNYLPLLTRHRKQQAASTTPTPASFAFLRGTAGTESTGLPRDALTFSPQAALSTRPPAPPASRRDTAAREPTRVHRGEPLWQNQMPPSKAQQPLAKN